MRGEQELIRNYKQYNTVCLGKSAIARLTVHMGSLFGCIEGTISFGKQGTYNAYEVWGSVKIPKRYSLICGGNGLLRIWNDGKMVYNSAGRFEGHKYRKYDIYRAGDTGCLIHWHD